MLKTFFLVDMQKNESEIGFSGDEVPLNECTGKGK